MPYTPDLDRLLTPGARFTDQHGGYLIEVHPVGDVVLPTGQVVGCDPLVCPEAEPFTVTVPPGRYAARAWVAVVLREDAEVDRRVAALELVVSDEPTIRWEPAVAGDQDVATLGADDYFGYGVDAGAGTLADPTALAVLEGWDYDRVEEVFIPDRAALVPGPGADHRRVGRGQRRQRRHSGHRLGRRLLRHLDRPYRRRTDHVVRDRLHGRPGITARESPGTVALGDPRRRRRAR